MNTGSLINNLMGNPTTTAPEVGMGATVLLWSDRHAATVVEVITAKKIVIQQDKATRTDDLGMSDSQDYTYERDETAPKETYTLRKNGSWVRAGSPMKDGTRLRLGVRDEHYDFSF